MASESGVLSIENLSQIALRLEYRRDHIRSAPLENSSVREDTRRLLAELESVMFPAQHPWPDGDASSAPGRIELLGLIAWRSAHLIHRTKAHGCDLALAQSSTCSVLAEALTVAQILLNELPEIQTMLIEDVESTFQGDPAAQSREEVIFTYPGFYATMVYRLAHLLYQHQAPLLARVMSEIAHRETGIDIHPGAHIGRRFFIDHGTGVVVGETAVIGSGVTLYQGVTLGAVNFPRDPSGAIIRGQKRHPTIEDDVVIYSGATILGGATVIGRASVIGGNVWITESVPALSKVTAEPKVELSTTAHPL
ncbi:MAG: serine acetyltransferase [Firmicutes bacterium]|jgi:serine O-acetyltransferase|nr:serine acetyltransferase [Bacillota bacterium]